jgi:hypothetical protein
MSFPCLNYVFSFAGMNEGNCDDNHNQTVAVPIQSVKTARPSLAKIILSQESDTAKQQALNHILTALQIIYARYGTFMINNPYVRTLTGSYYLSDLSSSSVNKYFGKQACHKMFILYHRALWYHGS